MSFIENGYDVVELFATSKILVGKARETLKHLLGGTPEHYHERAKGDQELTQKKALDALSGLPRAVITDELAYFKKLLGPDLHIQQRPYLRISRPGLEDDNIGYHRDTWYGDTPYELSVWIPLTHTDSGNCLRLAPGSHVWPEAKTPTERYERPDVPKGGVKHELGFIYSPPKRLTVDVPMTPISVRVGQMLVFSLACLHGQKVNESTKTRVSVDVRITNSYAPVKMSRSRNKTYYEPLCSSPVTLAAQRYKEAQCSPSQ